MNTATTDTPLDIQSLIDDCHRMGGGIVTIPPGCHPTGTLYLKSGVYLHLSPRATLVPVDDRERFPVLRKTVNNHGGIRALIYAENAQDIGIYGMGTLDGQTCEPLNVNDAEEVLFRPELIFLYNCKNVRVSEISLINASFWTFHLLRCEDVVIDRLRIRNQYNRINTDGIDVDGSKRVQISNCDIVTGDDCIVLKSTEGDCCEDIVVCNCLLTTHCTALKLGTESHGNIRNVLFNSVVIRNSRMAFGLFMKDGGLYENIKASNLVIESGDEFPIFIDNTPRFHGKSKEGKMRNISLESIHIQSPGRVYIQGGATHPIESLRIHGIQWDLNGYKELGSMGKPPGSILSAPDPERVRHEFQKAHFTLSNIDGFSLNEVIFTSQRSGKPADRCLIYASNVRQADWGKILLGEVEWLPDNEFSPVIESAVPALVDA